MIEIENVSKRYGSVWALREVSLRVEEGSVLGLLGQNGAGKTTLLNILTGYLAPTEGRVLLDGYDPLLNPAQAKRRLGYLPEHPPLYDEMTVREYLRFAAELRGVRRGGIAAHVDEIIALTGLEGMQNRLLAHLSKGYRQRAGLAQALCADPAVLVLDEPTVGLDPKQITETRALIRTLGKGRTIVFSSHILSEVQQLCDHVVILDGGAVRLDRRMDGGNEREITLSVLIGARGQRVTQALSRLPGVTEVSEHPEGDDATAAIITFTGQAEPERALWRAMSGVNAPILRLTRAEDSLEQVFLHAISSD